MTSASSQNPLLVSSLMGSSVSCSRVVALQPGDLLFDRQYRALLVVNLAEANDPGAVLAELRFERLEFLAAQLRRRSVIGVNREVGLLFGGQSKNAVDAC